jgi:hypothetical protein
MGVRPIGTQSEAADTEAALKRAREEGAAEARGAFEAIRAQDLAGYEQRLAEADRRFAEKTADALAAQLDESLVGLQTSLNAQVARVLGRFLEGAVRECAVRELGETVASLIATSGAARIKISGPAALVERFRATASMTAPVEVVADPAAVDLAVMLDDTLVETRIAAWLERLTAAVQGDADG